MSVNESRRWRSEGKIQLYDDREERLLTGSISHVTEQHSEYWCGVQSDGGHKSFITRVLINLTEPSSSTPPSSSLSSLSSSSSASSTSSFSGDSRTSPSPASLNTSGSPLIVSLVLLLVLIIAGLSLLFLCKKRQSPGADSSSQTGPGKHEVVSPTGCDYEEIKDSHKPLPTNPSDSSDVLYATAQLPTNPSDSSAFLYATAQLPSNPSDSSARVYATVQKAAGDSQCFITSAEDLNYAVVNFHKKSDCPDSVSVRNNQDYSEYAAVNHLSA
ncbi:uncharacterized protein [Pseudorasbora parva]|uniref:uncharacterized protein isoform X1 n=1 Tax=Pseudorasbora parva TaxID=51549 RepID=UPI00351E116B